MDSNENPRLLCFMRIHARSCRELNNDNPTTTRSEELFEIIASCENEYPILRGFRLMTPECAEINRIMRTRLVAK
jgi:hypothetical protein